MNFASYMIDLDESGAILRYLNVAQMAQQLGDKELVEAALNKAKELMKKDLGRVLVQSLSTVPISKDASPTDAVEQFINKARTEGVIYVDDNGKNL